MITSHLRLNDLIEGTKSSTGLSWQMQLAVFTIAALAVISRRPDAVTNPQFFAEDGAVWYADAYRVGLHSLLLPYAGYFQTFPRIVATLAATAPLPFAPLLMNVIGIAVQVSPINILASARCANFGTLPFRLSMGLLYLALPNSREVDVVVTNAQWHLALLACLGVLALPSSRFAWRLFDVVIVLFSGLTGPFCLALFPVALVVWWKLGQAWNIVLAVLLAGCSAVQLYALATTAGGARSHAILGASPMLFVRMLVGDVYLGSILGRNHFASRGPALLLFLLSILATAVLVYCFLRSAFEIRLFILYCFLIYAASLRNPMISYDRPQWPVLANSPGLRYWFFPMLAFAWSLLFCAQPGQSKWVRRFATAILGLMVIGIAKDWEDPAFSNHHFAQYAKKFEDAPPGKAMVFPLYPDGWTMQLVKSSRSCEAPPIGFVDEPATDAIVADRAMLRGWVTAHDPVENLRVYLDGIFVETLVPNILRKDVDQKFPGSSVKYKGWQGTLDVSKQRDRALVIEISAKLTDGCEFVFGTRSVKIAPR